MICYFSYQPILTVGQPAAGAAPQRARSPVRRAGLPPISTVVLPIGKTLTVRCPVLGGIGQICWSPATAAGIPPIQTVDTPGPATVPPCVVTSPNRAAAGISVFIQLIFTSDPFKTAIAAELTSAPPEPSSLACACAEIVMFIPSRLMSPLVLIFRLPRLSY